MFSFIQELDKSLSLQHVDKTFSLFLGNSLKGFSLTAGCNTVLYYATQALLQLQITTLLQD